MDTHQAEELVRRMAAALRGMDLYSPGHPIVTRGMDAFSAGATSALDLAPSFVVGFVGDEVVVDDTRLPRGSAALVGFARDLREREIEKITFSRGATRDEIRGFLTVLSDRHSPASLADRLTARGVRRIAIGKVAVDTVSEE